MFVQIGALRPSASAAVSGYFPGTGGSCRNEKPCNSRLSRPCPVSCLFLLLPRSVRMRHGGRDLCSGEPPLTPPLNSGAVGDKVSPAACVKRSIQLRIGACGSCRAVVGIPQRSICKKTGQAPHPTRVMVDLICLFVLSYLISARSNCWFFFVQGRFEETNGRTSPLPVAVPP